MDNISKTLIVLGCVLIFFGLVWHFTGGKIPLGNLPGDIKIENDNTKIYIPITTSIILSGILSFILYLIKK
jgi:hypothetical protein